MIDKDQKVRENLVRRAVARRGYQLQKARRRDPRAYDYATYQVVDPDTGAVVFGSSSRWLGKSLADVEAWLQRPGT